MIWLAIGLLAVAALAPLLIVLEGGVATRGPRELAMALHRTQLTELDRDLVEGRILPAEHATAVLEVQRRLLSAAESADQVARLGSRAPVIATALLVPALAVMFYMVHGRPTLPSATPAPTARPSEEAGLIEQLRDRLRTLDPQSDQARQGYVLLGNVEEGRDNHAAAAEAWRTALAIHFDATLAVLTAAASEQAEGTLSTGSAALLRRALAADPEAPWRDAVQERLRQADAGLAGARPRSP